MHVQLTEKHRVLHIALNRPDKRNALSAEMCRAMVDSILGADTRDDIGSILITANGTVFSAGMDLDEALGSQDPELTKAHESLFTIGARSLKPIVVAVNGAALGGGLGLVAQGHVVLAAEGASFALPEIRIGFWPFLVYRAMEAALGARRTLELSLTGRSFYAQQACVWGLVHQVCPNAEIGERAKAMARELAKISPVALSTGMQYVRQATGKSCDEAGELGGVLRQRLMVSPDFEEGILAMKQKREPHWPSLAPAKVH